MDPRSKTNSTLLMTNLDPSICLFQLLYSTANHIFMYMYFLIYYLSDGENKNIIFTSY